MASLYGQAAMRGAPGKIAGGPAAGQGAEGAQVTGDPGLEAGSWGASFWCLVVENWENIWEHG